jgi:hypothetical protein
MTSRPRSERSSPHARGRHDAEEDSMKRSPLHGRALAFASALAAAAAAATLALAAASSLAAGTLPALRLALTAKSVTVSGSELAGAVEVVSTVSGERADNPPLFLLRPGVTPARFARAVASFGKNTPFDAIDPHASIVFDGTARAGRSTAAQTWLVAGTYVAV